MEGIRVGGALGLKGVVVVCAGGQTITCTELQLSPGPTPFPLFVCALVGGWVGCLPDQNGIQQHSHKPMPCTSSSSLHPFIPPGKVTIVEYDPDLNALKQTHCETFGKTGCRRIVPGQVTQHTQSQLDTQTDG